MKHCSEAVEIASAIGEGAFDLLGGSRRRRAQSRQALGLSVRGGCEHPQVIASGVDEGPVSRRTDDDVARVQVPVNDPAFVQRP